ncbi:MAG: RecQ family ATP-dependent DNA helicase [Candidatus Binatia bacterium]|nr:RecQ family ATP-dependent DNA helicase [Candidatus Binatia bacterium]
MPRKRKTTPQDIDQTTTASGESPDPERNLPVNEGGAANASEAQPSERPRRRSRRKKAASASEPHATSDEAAVEQRTQAPDESTAATVFSDGSTFVSAPTATDGEDQAEPPILEVHEEALFEEIPEDASSPDEVSLEGAALEGTEQFEELPEGLDEDSEGREEEADEEEPVLAENVLAAPPVGDNLSPEEIVRRAQVREAARRLGIQQLYPEQERAIFAAMEGQDVLVVLPTGFGKSACYQIPSMILPKPVVLVSPLLALLRDQHEKLLARRIPVERIDGTVRGRARKEALDRIEAGGSLLVMTTPETLSSEELGEVLLRCGISLAAVDEAHCISEWGHDFRPAYMRLGERLHELGNPPVLALTATATQAVRDDIVRYLGMRNPAIVASSPHRANLAFEVVHATGNERLRALFRFIKRLRRPGIVYCATTKEVDRLYGAMARMRLPVHRYHGRMAAKDRNREQELFMRKGRRTIMVATSAFGLGIDKPDIRYIIHYQAPASLEQYVQEAGRAGRDGRRANCILLFDPGDREVHETLQQASRIRPDQLYRISTALAAYAAEQREPDMEALTLAAQLNERQAKALLVVLEEAGLVRLEEDKIHIVVPADEFEEQARALAGRFVTLRTQDVRRLDRIAEYARSKECRAVFLRRYFGEEDGTPCGLCDICRGASERPVTFYQPIARPEKPKKKKRKRKRKKSKQGKATLVITAGHSSGAPPPPEEPLPDMVTEPEPLPQLPDEP